MEHEDYTDFVHTGPGTLGGRYLRRFWQAVYRGVDLAPGRAVPIRIMSEDMTLYRGEEGAPHVVAFRCAHRGTQLSTGWVEGDCLRCRYHGWKYDGSGQCVEQPGEEESFAGKVRIRSYPTQEYKGIIFAYFGEDTAPDFPRFLEFEGIVETVATEIWPCNYSNRLDNDPNHIPFVHRESRLRTNIRASIPKVVVEETEYGMKSTHLSSSPEDESHTNYKIWPNGAQHGAPIRIHTSAVLDESESGGGWMDRRLWRVPVDDEHCISFGVNLVHLTGDVAKRYQERRDEERREQAGRTKRGPTAVELGQAVLAGKLRLEDVKDLGIYTLVMAEDYLSQCGQGGIPDYKNERMAVGDAATFLRRKIWERELTAFAGGGVLKQWVCPLRLSSVVGV